MSGPTNDAGGAVEVVEPLPSSSGLKRSHDSEDGAPPTHLLSDTKRCDYIPWDKYFMAVAFLSAMRSKDPRSQVGACIVNSEKKIVGIGYNGMPRGCSDDKLTWDKNYKHMYVCHAEMNAIMNKNSSDLAGCKIYVALFPCNECAKLIIQAGIREVVFYSNKLDKKKATKASKRLLDLAKVVCRQYIPVHTKIQLDFSGSGKRDTDSNTRSETNTSTPQPKSPRDVNKKREDYLAWGEYFMAVATLSALRSKDPVTQVGACIVNVQNKIVGIGYNGMPRGCSDKDLPWGNTSLNELDRKHMYVCHAEVNAIMNKNCADVSSCTIYVGLFPCNECAKVIIQAGITKVIYASDNYQRNSKIGASKEMLDMAGIEYTPYNIQHKKLEIDFKSIDWNNKNNRQEQ